MRRSDELADARGQKKGGEDGRAPGGGGYTKRGKPRPGTGGYRRDKLEGKGPTPPAHLRPGPSRAAGGGQGGRAPSGRPGQRGNERGGAGRDRSDSPGENPATRGSGEGPEMVAGRNSVVESLRAGIPAMALYVAGPGAGGRAGRGVRAAGGGGRHRGTRGGLAELDRLTGGAIHQGVALRVRPYEYAHPEDLAATDRAGPAAHRGP